jgi:glutathione-regulated potassium-efflux system ancillary protein KefG
MADAKVLVLFAHPSIHHSRVQRVLARAAREVEGIAFHDLYEAYPDFDVDVAAEQKRLAAHDAIVLQHPFYWYSTPPLVKQWMDLVLEHGWAYGRGGEALRGKRFLSAISAGGREESYCSEGSNCFSVRQLLAPIEQTVVLCGMRYLDPFVVYGTHALGDVEIDAAARAYAARLAALRDGAA